MIKEDLKQDYNNIYQTDQEQKKMRMNENLKSRTLWQYNL